MYPGLHFKNDARGIFAYSQKNICMTDMRYLKNS